MFSHRPPFHSRLTSGLGLVLLLALILSPLQTGLAAEPGNQHFQRTWERTDRPVLDSVTARTWMWGPEAFTEVLDESYAEAPGGKRSVQYYDKARMEITNPTGDSASIWYVTNGLLVIELITGKLQFGDDTFEQRTPALVNVAGDADDPTGPTYASFGLLLDDPALQSGALLTARVDRSGNVSNDPSLAAHAVTSAYVDEVTNHAIAGPFWTFMNSDGTIYAEDQFSSNKLFENAFFATGRPITEAYWANVKVGGNYRDVLTQCFERRCLTYTPGNPAGFVVEAGNVGQHYYAWRYTDPTPPEEKPAPTEPPVTPTESSPTATEPPVTPTEPSATPTEPAATPTQEPTATPIDESEPTPDPATEYEFDSAWGGRADKDTAFDDPTDVAVAPNGNVYMIDKLDRVQVFDADGIWVKSWGAEGSEPGQFDNPEGIAVDTDEHVYVADYGNQRVQKFDLDGALVDVWEIPGYPSDVAVDGLGLVFISDMSNHKVWIFYRNGDFRNDFGEFGGEPGQLFLPKGIAVHPDANVYIADTGNNRVQIFNVNGELLGGFGSKGEEQGQFKSPEDVVFAPGGGAVLGSIVYVSDAANHRIQSFTQNPVAAPPIASRTLAATMSFSYSGQFGTRGEDDGQFILPDGLALDSSGNLYVADFRNDRVQKFGKSFTGGFQHRDSWHDGLRGRFNALEALALGPDGKIYAADDGLAQIQIFTPDGKFDDRWDDIATLGMAFDSQGTLYLTNNDQDRVEQYDQEGVLLSAWEPSNSAFFRQGALAIDADDNIYVLQTLLGSIQKFRPDGTYLDAWGAPGSQPGQFASPAGVAIYGDFVYISDRVNHRIQQFDRSGNFIRAWGDQDTGAGALLLPWGIAVDADGYVYVSDHGNDRIVKYTPDGEYLAHWGTLGSAEGQFYEPTAIAVDADGKVYVADYGNYRIQVFQPVS